MGYRTGGLAAVLGLTQRIVENLRDGVTRASTWPACARLERERLGALVPPPFRTRGLQDRKLSGRRPA